MGWEPAGPGSSEAVGATWILPASHLASGPVGDSPCPCVRPSRLTSQDPFPQSGNLLDSGEVGRRFPWASGFVPGAVLCLHPR